MTLTDMNADIVTVAKNYQYCRGSSLYMVLEEHEGSMK